MKKVFFTLLAFAAVNTLSAQDSTKIQADSLQNDSTYWDNMILPEVVVKSTIPTTRVNGDAMRTTVSGSILEKAGSATDALSKIPTLKTEKGSAPEVIGRGAAEVYINGRKVQDMNELDRLRSEDIRYIDVISTPGARYAATTKAVIRITMKKPQGEGWSFLENAGCIYQYGWTGTNNLDVNYRTGGLDITGSFWGGTYGHSRGNSENNIFYLIGNDRFVGRSKQNHNSRWNGISPQLQVNYVFNENHSFGAFYKWDRNLKSHSAGWFLMDNYKNDELIESMLSDISRDGGFRKNIFNAYYNGKVGNLSIDWNLDGLFGRENEESSTQETTTYYDGTPESTGCVDNTTEYSNDFWATKLILSYPIWEGNLSIGSEYTHNNRTDVYHVKSEDTLPIAGSDTRLTESSTSGFVEYGRRFGALYAQAGLRYEYLDNDYSNFGIRQDEASRSYGDWFPTLTLAYPIARGPQLSLSYRKDIQRPPYSQLSSSILYINKYSYQSGNPYLTPIYTHNVTLNAAYRWANLTVIYQRIKDDIVLQSMPYPGSTDPMVTLIKPVNCPDDYNRITVSLAARPVIGAWHPMWSAAVFFQNYKSLTLDGSMITLDRPYVSLTWNNDFVLPHEWRINALVQFANKGDYMTYRMTRCLWSTSVGVQKDLNINSLGRFTFDLRCYDPFNLKKTGTIVYGIRQIEACNPARRTISLDITWRFNEAQKKYKGRGAGESQKNRM